MLPTSQLFSIFLTGLTTGGLTCAAMQGGLLASVIANQKQHELELADKRNTTPQGHATFDLHDMLPTSMFLISKLFIHLLLGALLGFMGSFFLISFELQIALQALAAIFLFSSAMNLMNIHPLFRFFSFQPPKWVHHFLKKHKASPHFFAPSIVGLLTVLVPCGVTQAMAILAISTKSPLDGALIMGSFVLGTMPVFLAVGTLTSRLSEVGRERFLTIAAAVLIFLSLSNINSIATVLNAPFTFQTIVDNVEMAVTPPTLYAQKYRLAQPTKAVTQAGVQKVHIDIQSEGYSPTFIQVKKNAPVELELTTKEVYSCASSFVLKQFNIAEQLGPDDRRIVRFTPTQVGKFPFSCSMGMFTGTLEVVDT